MVEDFINTAVLVVFVSACYCAGTIIIPGTSKESASVETRASLAMLFLGGAIFASSYLCSILPKWGWVSFLFFGISMVLFGIIVGVYRRQKELWDTDRHSS